MGKWGRDQSSFRDEGKKGRRKQKGKKKMKDVGYL